MTSPNDAAFAHYEPGQAFATAGPRGEMIPQTGPAIYHPGLTKREEFAKAAMQGMLAGLYADSTATASFEGVAKDSLGYADALIAELNREK